jgi:protein TonB
MLLAATNLNEADTITKPSDKKFEYVLDLIAPTFPGGIEGWQKYLINNLKSDVPLINHAPSGMYTAVVSFMIDDNGKVSDVKVIKDPGFGTGAEAVRVIKEGPKWIPAQQNGHKVTAMTKQAISFKVE